MTIMVILRTTVDARRFMGKGTKDPFRVRGVDAKRYSIQMLNIQISTLTDNIYLKKPRKRMRRRNCTKSYTEWRESSFLRSFVIPNPNVYNLNKNSLRHVDKAHNPFTLKNEYALASRNTPQRSTMVASFHRVSHVSRVVSATKQQSNNADSTCHYGLTM
jgi:hypothetical protein